MATLYQFTVLLLALGFMMLIPVPTALAEGDDDAVRTFLISAFLALTLSTAIILALRRRRRTTGRLSALTLVALGWVGLSLFAMVPFLELTDVGASLAFFEAVSALTTTGFTAYTNIDGLQPSLILWRGVLQWYGGLLTLLMIILVLSPLGSGGMPMRHIALRDAMSPQKSHRIRVLIFQVTTAYLASTVACQAWLSAAGTSPFEALVLTLSTVSTGGMTPHNAPVGDYVSPLGQFGLIVFMLIGATNVYWQGAIVRLRTSQFYDHIESYVLIVGSLILGIAIALAALQAAGASLTPLRALREGVFTAASLASTTGFEIREAAFSVLPLTAVLAIVLVGGASASTAGGIKPFRFGILMIHGQRELLQSIYANAVRRRVIAGRRWSLEDIGSVWVFFIASILLLIVSFSLLAFALPFDGALTAAVAAFSNAGPIYDQGPDAAAPWPDFRMLPWWTHMVLVVTMIAGRIELVGLLGFLFLPRWTRE